MCFLFNKKYQVNGTKTIGQKLKNNQSPLELPSWMIGDVNNLNEVEEFVSKDESSKRIILISLVISTFLISIATSFSAICMRLSSSPIAKKEWNTPDVGKTGKFNFNIFVVETDKRSTIF